MTWAFDVGAIEEIARLMGVTQPIYLIAKPIPRSRTTAPGMRVTGRHSPHGSDAHRISVRPTLDPMRATGVIVHELQHSVQRERFPSSKEFHAAYELEAHDPDSYGTSPMEAEARAAEDAYWNAGGGCLVIPGASRPKEVMLWP